MANTPSLSTLIVPLTSQQMLAQLLAIMQRAPWQPNTNVMAGSFNVANGNLYGALTSGTTAASGTGPAGTGANIPDGNNGLAWAYLCPSNNLPAFPTTSWQPGSFGDENLQLDSIVFAFWQIAISNIAAMGCLATAANPALQTGPGGTSPWVDVAAEQVFNETRQQPTTCVGYFTLTDAGGLGPTVVTAGSVQASDGNGHTYKNVNAYDGTVPGFTGSFSGGTIPKNGSLICLFTAAGTGSSYNIAPSTPLSLLTALPGVTVSCPALIGSQFSTPPFTLYPQPILPFGTQWIVSPGTDVETDASLIQRCQNKWGETSTGSPSGTWQNWCFNASADVRTALVNPTGFGTVPVTVYGNNTGVSNADLTTITNYIQTREPTCIVIANGGAQNAPAVPCYVTVTLYGPASVQTSATAAALGAVLNLIQNTQVGGNNIIPGTPDQTGIANDAFTTAAQVAAGAQGVTKCTAAVAQAYGDSSVLGADFLMPPDPATGLSAYASATDPAHSVTQTVTMVWVNI
jgi:Baseplate J-like protein